MYLDKLKGKLREKKVTYLEIANLLNITTTTVSFKMNGISKFYFDEIIALSNYLELSNEEKIRIFFDK